VEQHATGVLMQFISELLHAAASRSGSVHEVVACLPTGQASRNLHLQLPDGSLLAKAI